jgi:hypothetical protein
MGLIPTVLPVRRLSIYELSKVLIAEGWVKTSYHKKLAVKKHGWVVPLYAFKDERYSR